MKNKHFTPIFLLFAAAILPAQNEASFRFETGLGIGLLPTFAKDRSRSIALPLNAGFSYRVAEKFSFGAFGGYSVSSAVRPDPLTREPVRYENRFRFGGLRLAVHTDPQHFARWDLYGGMSGMYTMMDVTRTPAAKSSAAGSSVEKVRRAGFTATGFLGARFALTKRLGLWGELGFGAALLNGGMSYRFVSRHQ